MGGKIEWKNRVSSEKKCNEKFCVNLVSKKNKYERKFLAKVFVRWNPNAKWMNDESWEETGELDSIKKVLGNKEHLEFDAFVIFLN